MPRIYVTAVVLTLAGAACDKGREPSQETTRPSDAPAADASAANAAPSDATPTPDSSKDAAGPGLAVGASAPDFTLTDHNGQALTLASLLEQGPVIAVFYRGHW